MIRVHKPKPQLLGHQLADGGFARAHETNERDVGPGDGSIHARALAQPRRQRTVKTPFRRAAARI
jgi:hypothetical protein